MAQLLVSARSSSQAVTAVNWWPFTKLYFSYSCHRRTFSGGCLWQWRQHTRGMQEPNGTRAGYAWDKWAPDMDSLKRVAPAAERNKEPILEQLHPLLPQDGLVLEVASGTGQHIAHFAAALSPSLQWQPSDVTDDSFDSIRAYTVHLSNVRPPVVLDASQPADQWPVQGPCAAVLAANVTHIAPWAVTLGLLSGAGKILQPGGILFIYGPFKIDGKFTSDSNESFHYSLVSQNPAWGYRDAGDIAAAAAAAGLQQQAIITMPANNFALVFVKQQ